MPEVIAIRDDYETILHQVRTLEVRRREDLRVLRGITHEFKAKKTLPPGLTLPEMLHELAFARSELEGTCQTTAADVARLQKELEASEEVRGAVAMATAMARSGSLAPQPSTSGRSLLPTPLSTTAALSRRRFSRESEEGDLLEDLPAVAEEGDGETAAPGAVQPSSGPTPRYTAYAASTVGDLEGAVSISTVFAAMASDELEAMLTAHARRLPDSDAAAAVRQAFAEIAERFDMRLAGWRTQYSRYVTEHGGPTGSWSVADHDAFLHWRKELGKSAARAVTGTDTNRADLTRLVSTMLPHKTYDEVTEHEGWWVGLKILQERRKEIGDAWQRTQAQFLDSTRKFLSGLAAEAESHVHRMKSVLEVEVKRDRLHRELGALREDRFVQDQVQRGMQSLAREKKSKAEAAAAAQRRAESVRQKALLQEWAAQLAARRREEEAAERAAEAARARDLAAQAVLNEKRVSFRQTLQEQKEREREQERMEDGLREQERLRRLEKLRATVQVHVAADPERAMGPTASTLAEKAGEGSGAEFRVNNGYATEELLRDPRFRVALALHERGLTGGQAAGYAREIIANTRPAKLTRVDNLTTGQIDSLVQGRGIF